MVSALFDLSGRTALVTGASQGIGLAIAEGLAGAGASLVLNGRTASKLEQAADMLRAKGAAVATTAFDVTDAAAAQSAIDQLEGSGTAIDILVKVLSV